MQILRKIKIGPFLVISSVLAVWMLLAAQPAQAHKPDIPSCSGLPTAVGFFTGSTAAIAPGALTPALTATQGTGSAAKGGNTKYRYAKITVPQLAAGELRVFDIRTDAGAASDAVLCHGSSTRARYRTTHPSSHSSAESARTSALAAQTRATTAAANTTITESSAKSALRSAATALRSAATSLRSVATALTRAATAATTAGDTAAATALTTAADAATTAANNAYTPASGGTPASGHAVDAATAANTPANDPADASDETTALGTAASNLGTAAGALRTAANALHDTDGKSTVFQLRAEVRPGDQEYILVTTDDAPTLAVQFHGAIAATSARRNRSFTRGNQDTISITITAPGLLTLETTGSTDTKGMLDDSTGAEVAYAESGGSGDNFKMFVPVELDAADPASTTAATYNMIVEGQTLDTEGEYTLGMDFKVAMTTTGITAAPVHPSAKPWPDNVTVDDDTMVEIKRIAEDGRTADADYFLFIPATSGFLTVNANDDATSAKDSDTKGTLYGAMGEGPTGEMRVGEIATDAASGPGNHFAFTVPVEMSKNYLVKVEGTDGKYVLEFSHDPVPSSQTVTSTAPTARYTIAGNADYEPADLCLTTATTNRSNEICSSTGDQHKDQYLLNIAESGTLYVHSTGTTDVDVFLFGPAGDLIDSDADSGTLTNFNMATKVDAGLHLLEVRGKTKSVQGYYEMFVNFVAGDVEPTTPTTPTTPGTGDDLQARVNELEAQLRVCQAGVEVDATGFLGNPVQDGVVSGIGLISGWVCAANTVEIRITNAQGGRVAILDAAYGTNRPDVSGNPNSGCTNANAGFGMTYNFNALPEGEYRIAAYADGQTLIGFAHTFEVVHLVDFANDDLRPFGTDDDDRFLRNLEGTCTVPNFPTDGETTTLEWEQGIQNFVIMGVR